MQFCFFQMNNLLYLQEMRVLNLLGNMKQKSRAAFKQMDDKEQKNSTNKQLDQEMQAKPESYTWRAKSKI